MEDWDECGRGESEVGESTTRDAGGSSEKKVIRSNS